MTIRLTGEVAGRIAWRWAERQRAPGAAAADVRGVAQAGLVLTIRAHLHESVAHPLHDSIEHEISIPTAFLDAPTMHMVAARTATVATGADTVTLTAPPPSGDGIQPTGQSVGLYWLAGRLRSFPLGYHNDGRANPIEPPWYGEPLAGAPVGRKPDAISAVIASRRFAGAGNGYVVAEIEAVTVE